MKTMVNMATTVYCLFFLTFAVVEALPNFIIFLADDLGYGDVGCFGNNTLRTPNIDSLAANGMKLNHHLAAAAVCTPSRAALLTGRYPIRSGMESSNRNKVFFFVAATGGLPPNETTFTTALKQQGYSTAIIGKWHLGNDCVFKGDACHHPLNHGFDYFYGLPLSNFKDFGDDGQSVITSYTPNFYSYMMTIIICGLTFSCSLFPNWRILAIFTFILTVITPAFVIYFTLNLKTINGIIMRNKEIVEQPITLSGLTQRFVKEAEWFLKEQAISGEPFLLYMPFIHVHTALFSSKKFYGKSKHGHYGDNVEELDWAVGKVMKMLETLNLTNDTFVYFSSDNGGHIEETGADGQREGGYNGIFKGGKMMAGMEGGIRVPSIISWPGHVLNGTATNIVTSQMDLFPTIMQLAEISLPHDRIIDGRSLVPIFEDEVSASHHNFLYHYCGRQIHAATYIPHDGKNIWKIHWTTPKFLPGTNRCEFVCHCFGNFVVHHNPPLLYDISIDPSESHPLNVSSNLKFAKIISEVTERCTKHKESIEIVPDQFSFFNTVWKPWLQPCCNFPYCNCTDSLHAAY